MCIAVLPYSSTELYKLPQLFANNYIANFGSTNGPNELRRLIYLLVLTQLVVFSDLMCWKAAFAANRNRGVVVFGVRGVLPKYDTRINYVISSFGSLWKLFTP